MNPAVPGGSALGRPSSRERSTPSPLPRRWLARGPEATDESRARREAERHFGTRTFDARWPKRDFGLGIPRTRRCKLKFGLDVMRAPACKLKFVLGLRGARVPKRESGLGLQRAPHCKLKFGLGIMSARGCKLKSVLGTLASIVGKPESVSGRRARVRGKPKSVSGIMASRGAPGNSVRAVAHRKWPNGNPAWAFHYVGHKKRVPGTVAGHPGGLAGFRGRRLAAPARARFRRRDRCGR